MSLFLQIKPVGWLTEGGREEKGGRVRNWVRSIKKVRFLGQREGATTTCSFLQAALAVSLSRWASRFLVLGRLPCLILGITSAFSTNQPPWSQGHFLHPQPLSVPATVISTNIYLKNGWLVLATEYKACWQFPSKFKKHFKVCFLQATVLGTLRLYVTPRSYQKVLLAESRKPWIKTVQERIWPNG